MALMNNREPLQLSHYKKLNCADLTRWWTCKATSFGRCGIKNLCGHEIRKYIMRLRGDLSSGSGGEYGY
jgi:hypothetical protein